MCAYAVLTNIGLIPNFEKLIATIRSREISAAVILQAQSQLKSIYKDNMDTIVGNMDTTLFLGGKEKTTLKDIAESLGKETIDLMNTSMSFGQQKSHSQSNQRLGRDLMGVDEISVMDGSKCILQVRGVRPFLSNKYDIEKHHNYKYLADANPAYNFNIAKFLKKEKRSGKEVRKGLTKANAKIDRIIISEDKPIAKPKIKGRSSTATTADTAKTKGTPQNNQKSNTPIKTENKTTDIDMMKTAAETLENASAFESGTHNTDAAPSIEQTADTAEENVESIENITPEMLAAQTQQDSTEDIGAGGIEENTGNDAHTDYDFDENEDNENEDDEYTDDEYLLI